VSPPWNADALAIDPAVPHRLYGLIGPWILINQITQP
jgi:hypothetical protein